MYPSSVSTERLSLERLPPPNTLYDLMFSPEGAVVVVLILFGALVVLRFVTGATDDISPKMREEWESHHQRFKSKDAVEYLRGKAEDESAIKFKRQILMDTPREIIEVATNLGSSRVTVLGNKRAKIAIVTLHDVGTNWHHCFTNLQRELVDEKFFDVFNFVHVNIVGHEEHAKFDSDTSTMSLEALAQMVHCIVQELQLSYFVILGVGAGANTALRYACNHVDQVRGLILVNPLVQAPSPSERSTLKRLSSDISSKKWEKAADSVAAFHFTRQYLQSKPRVRDSLHVSLQNMNDHAIKDYIHATAARDSIDNSRLLALAETPILCIGGGVRRSTWTGGRSDNAGEIQHLRALLGERTCDAIVDGNLSGIPTEEDPTSLVLAIKLFLEQI